MSLISILVVTCILAILIIPVYRFYSVKRQSGVLYEKRFERIKALYEKLENGDPITADEVKPYAENLLTRKTAFQMLADKDKTNLFPNEFKTIVLGAESDLCNWLEFPTELGTCPDEIEHVEEVVFEMDKEKAIYQVFKFRMDEPHWAAKKGWLLGVAGPYFEDSEPYDNTVATFSRMKNKFGEVEPEVEALWVHKNIAIRRL